METKTTIASLSREVTTEAEAYSYLEGLRWGSTPTCGHCESTDVYLIQCANGTSRQTRTGNMSERRVWKCRSCKKQFSVLTNTILHGTRIPVRCWVMIYFEMAASKNGIAAREIERKYGFCPRTAWFVLHRLREAMSKNNGDILGRNVVVDETYVGGDPKNRHANDPRQSVVGRGTEKTAVVSLIDAETGEVRSKVVAKVDGATLYRFIRDNVWMAETTLHSDSFQSYVPIGQTMAGHYVVNHSAGEYVNEKSQGTNRAEGFFSQLKRSIDGTHHHVSVEHLHRYVSEFSFRFTTCEMKEIDRMRLMVQRSGGRLTYKNVKVSA
jgi:transposase-like protein